jgi:hypothetical protein
MARRVRGGLDGAIDGADRSIPASRSRRRGQELSSPTWARARGAKLYRPGAGPELGEHAAAAEALTAQLGVEPVRVEDARLARFLEEQGRLVRVGDGFAISPAAYEQARAMLVDGITLAQFRDALGVGRKTAQLYLERFDADGVTRRVGDARVLRRR